MSLSHHENHGSQGKERVYDKVGWYSSLAGMLMGMEERGIIYYIHPDLDDMANG